MKNLLFILIIATLISCKKESTTSSPNANKSYQYHWDTLYAYLPWQYSFHLSDSYCSLDFTNVVGMDNGVNKDVIVYISWKGWERLPVYNIWKPNDSIYLVYNFMVNNSVTVRYKGPDITWMQDTLGPYTNPAYSSFKIAVYH